MPRLILPGRQILYVTKLYLAHAGAGSRKDEERGIGGGATTTDAAEKGGGCPQGGLCCDHLPAREGL
jgi:hypothetical protein